MQNGAAGKTWQLQLRIHMTKKIERSRVEAGKAELPRKVSFLATEKVDYVAVLDRDGDLTVEVPAAALAKIVKARGELKALKSAQRQSEAAAAAALALEKEAHQATQAALTKAERRVKALDKKAASLQQPAGSVQAASTAPAGGAGATGGGPAKVSRKGKAATAPAVQTSGAPGSGGSTETQAAPVAEEPPAAT